MRSVVLSKFGIVPVNSLFSKILQSSRSNSQLDLSSQTHTILRDGWLIRSGIDPVNLLFSRFKTPRALRGGRISSIRPLSWLSFSRLKHQYLPCISRTLNIFPYRVPNVLTKPKLWGIVPVSSFSLRNLKSQA